MKIIFVQGSLSMAKDHMDVLSDGDREKGKRKKHIDMTEEKYHKDVMCCVLLEMINFL